MLVLLFLRLHVSLWHWKVGGYTLKTHLRSLCCGIQQWTYQGTCCNMLLPLKFKLMCCWSCICLETTSTMKTLIINWYLSNKRWLDYWRHNLGLWFVLYTYLSGVTLMRGFLFIPFIWTVTVALLQEVYRIR